MMAGVSRSSLFILTIVVSSCILNVELKSSISKSQTPPSYSVDSNKQSYSSSKPSSSSRGNSATNNGIIKPSYNYPVSSGNSGSKPSYPSSSGFSGNGPSGGSLKPSNYSVSSGSTGSKPLYPSSGGLSGSGSVKPGNNNISKPSYPNSGGLSGTGSNTGPVIPSQNYPVTSNNNGSKPLYPSSNGLSGSGSVKPGNNNISKPSYPNSGGLSGTGSNTGLVIPSQNYPVTSSNNGSKPLYPSSNGLSGSGSVKPASNNGSKPLYPNSDGPSGFGSNTGPVKPPEIYPVFSINNGSKPMYPTNGGLSGNGTNFIPLIPPYPGSGNSGYIQTSGSMKPMYPTQTGSNSNSQLSSGILGNTYPLQKPNNTVIYPSNGSSYPTGPPRSNITGVYSPNGSTYPTGFQRPNNTGYIPTSGSMKPMYSNSSSGIVHSYPPSFGGAGGSKPNNQPHYAPNSHMSNQMNNHYTQQPTVSKVTYVYKPPKKIVLNVPSQKLMVTAYYPVYTEPLPNYIYEYRNSASKYSNLLSGLALFNLGQTRSNKKALNYHNTYKPNRDEVCIFGVRYDNSYYEEMNIDCRTISNYLYMFGNARALDETNTKTVTVVNTTTVNFIGPNQTFQPNGMTTSVQQNMSLMSNQHMLPNGTLISTPLGSPTTFLPPIVINPNLSPNGTLMNTITQSQMQSNNEYIISSNGTLISKASISPKKIAEIQPNYNKYEMLPNGTLISPDQKQVISTSSVITTTTTQVVSSSDSRFQGTPVDVAKLKTCYIRIVISDDRFERDLDCNLLNAYAAQSFEPNSAFKTSSVITTMCFIVLSLLILR